MNKIMIKQKKKWKNKKGRINKRRIYVRKSMKKDSGENLEIKMKWGKVPEENVTRNEALSKISWLLPKLMLKIMLSGW